MSKKIRRSRVTPVISAAVVTALLLGAGCLGLVPGFSGNAAAEGDDVHYVTTSFTGLSGDAPASVDHGNSLTVTFTADDGHLLPETVAVTMGGVVLEEGDGYVYSIGTVTVNDITDDVHITADGVPANVLLLMAEEGSSFELYFSGVLQYVLTLGATGLFPIYIPHGTEIELRGTNDERDVMWTIEPGEITVYGHLTVAVTGDIAATATFASAGDGERDAPIAAADSEGGVGWSLIILVLLGSLLFYTVWARTRKQPADR